MKKLIFSLILVFVLGGAAFFTKDTILPGLGSDTLTISLSTEATDISPYGLNLNNATRTRNIYEGLVGFDRNLKIVPALAVSWGNLNDTTWEFRLREGVLFHDGTEFSAQDVVNSFNELKESDSRQIEPVISSIKEVRISALGKIEIVTFAPDPLLLSKLTKLAIFKEDHVGTGPYKFNNWLPGKHFKLKANKDYYGSAPSFDKVTYSVEKNMLQRENNFSSGETDISMGITETQALDLKESQVKESYGLEVNFLMFKLDDELFKERKYREAIQSLVNPIYIEAIGNNFVRSASQFVAPGVFGYNQDIVAPDYSKENEARELFGNRLERLAFDYLGSYKTLIEYLSSQMKKAGFSVKAKAVDDPNELLNMIAENESQLFLIGWRAEDGDAGGFFDAFVHSEGAYNNGRYVNPEVDKLIEASRREMEPQMRLRLLQEIGERVDDDLIGIPLFETSRLYAVQEGIEWQVRLDGLVLANEVSK